jgi:hypothetical protein
LRRGETGSSLRLQLFARRADVTQKGDLRSSWKLLTGKRVQRWAAAELLDLVKSGSCGAVKAAPAFGCNCLREGRMSPEG